jgi:hypothetical protein
MKQTTFNFKKRFVAAVETGVKNSTIRLFKKTTPPDKGDVLKLFTGMRTKKCRSLRKPTCSDCQPIQITNDNIILGKLKLSRAEENRLACDDGFASADHMRVFFIQTYGLPLPGKPHWVSWK